MNRDEAVTIVEIIVHGWPGPAWEVERMEAYVNALLSFEAKATTAAVLRAQKELRYRPSIAELREFIHIEQRLAEPEDSWRHQPPEPLPRPEWTIRWARARAANDWRPFPEQRDAMTRMANEHPGNFRVYSPPPYPTDLRDFWVQPDEYLEGERSAPDAIVELPDVP